jgi:hypothetical protein
MNKKKVYVLIVSDYFPAKHPLKGEQTYFEQKIRNNFENVPVMEIGYSILFKIHTIRANYELWKKRVNEINAGLAILSIRRWSGKPYRSEQIEIMQFEKLGIQKLEFKNGLIDYMLVDGRYAFTNIGNTIAKNDGLSLDDFLAWFKNYDLSKPMAILHFTNFRY